ncbi:MAG: peptide chain release factor N(5)-glutamine methyltransferase [Terracidiphilus sp.]
MTLQEWLNRGETQLCAGPHPGRARRDAELLLLHVLGKNKSWLMAHSEDKLPATGTSQFTGLLERRFRGEPIQYITGETEFYGLPLCVTPDVLIPRPETEHLVEKVLELAARFPNPRIVDVGAGSGAIAIALARHLPHAAITAVDLSAPALSIARENAKRNGVSGRIRFLEGDLLAPLVESAQQTYSSVPHPSRVLCEKGGKARLSTMERFEIVVSNPPYVPTTDRDTLSVEVRDYEPALALFAGGDGLDICRRLIPSAFDALTPGGFLVLEIGDGQSHAITGLLSASGFRQIEFLPDLQSIPRVACARRR